MKKELLTVKETAEFLNIAENTIRHGIMKKAKKPFPIQPIRIGGAVRFSKKKIEEFIGVE